MFKQCLLRLANFVDSRNYALHTLITYFNSINIINLIINQNSFLNNDFFLSVDIVLCSASILGILREFE